jgi:energy-coupling factor transport system ATP-binding protein
MALIECEHLSHVYMQGTPLETVALSDVSLSIDEGEVVGLIGPTGSGKSTLVQHFNGLLKPTSGFVRVAGVDLAAKGADLRQIRRHVGLLFQFPEYQLFEETVAADVAFGPRNLGLQDAEVRERVDDALELVGLDPAAYGPRSPFSLSGGEMRRVAIAGVLAMGPQVLVLDEPAAGLDPRGKEDILGQIRTLQQQRGLTVVIITHSMDEAAQMVRRLIVLDGGHVFLDGPVRAVFERSAELRSIGMDLPAVPRLMQRLKSRGLAVRTDVLTVDEARTEILRVLQWN